MYSPQIKVSIEYREVETDYSLCNICEQMIIGLMFQQVIIVNDQEVKQPIKFCEYCYNEPATKD